MTVLKVTKAKGTNKNILSELNIQPQLSILTFPLTFHHIDHCHSCVNLTGSPSDVSVQDS